VENPTLAPAERAIEEFSLDINAFIPIMQFN